jgi:hypothetical protein
MACAESCLSRSECPVQKWLLRRFRWRGSESITALAQLLATLHDHEAASPSRFYDEVKPLDDWERQAWRKLPVDGDKLIREETGVPELFGEAGYLWNVFGRGRLLRSTESAGYQGRGQRL